MARIAASRKNLSLNPLKMSAPLGGTMAFMGVAGTVPLLHGSQGCTAFSKVLMVRHFHEAIPVQTTAMSEITTILGGLDNLEQACLTIHRKSGCRVLGICTTGLTETRGEDLAGDLKMIKARNPELAGVELIGAATPDFAGGLEAGWAKTVTAMIETLVERKPIRDSKRVNILAGSHLTPGEIDAVRQMVEAFGLVPTVLPDWSGSLDGHVPETHMSTTYGGTTVEEIRAMGGASFTFAIGEHMRGPAEALCARTGVESMVLDRLTGLSAVDAFVAALQRLSGQSAPAMLRRQRSQLVDAMLDGHFHFGRAPVALAAEPDLLYGLSTFLAEMGAEIVTAVSPTESPILAQIPADSVLIGDLDDFEGEAGRAGAALLLTHSHGRGAAERLGVPLFRVGFPIFDRLGAQHRSHVGYAGTRDLIYAIGNLLMERTHDARPGDWVLPESEGDGHAAAKAH